jgi:hypothetical protein
VTWADERTKDKILVIGGYAVNNGTDFVELDTAEAITVMEPIIIKSSHDMMDDDFETAPAVVAAEEDLNIGWSEMPNLPRPRAGCRAVTVRSHVIVIGGESPNENNKDNAAVESNSFVTVSSNVQASATGNAAGADDDGLEVYDDRPPPTLTAALARTLLMNAAPTTSLDNHHRVLDASLLASLVTATMQRMFSSSTRTILPLADMPPVDLTATGRGAGVVMNNLGSSSTMATGTAGATTGSRGVPAASPNARPRSVANNDADVGDVESDSENDDDDEDDDEAVPSEEQPLLAADVSEIQSDDDEDEGDDNLDDEEQEVLSALSRGRYGLQASIDHDFSDANHPTNITSVNENDSTSPVPALSRPRRQDQQQQQPSRQRRKNQRKVHAAPLVFCTKEWRWLLDENEGSSCCCCSRSGSSSSPFSSMPPIRIPRTAAAVCIGKGYPRSFKKYHWSRDDDESSPTMARE